jgi:hypothetical protein
MTSKQFKSLKESALVTTFVFVLTFLVMAPFHWQYTIGYVVNRSLYSIHNGELPPDFKVQKSEAGNYRWKGTGYSQSYRDYHNEMAAFAGAWRSHKQNIKNAKKEAWNNIELKKKTTWNNI